MATVTLPLPDSVSEGEARLLLAIKLYEAKRLSSGQAAELAGFSKRSFIETLGVHGIPIFNSAADEVTRDLANA